jgi:photosystem II stability/assembly factor-like uncharacterized protein
MRIVDPRGSRPLFRASVASTGATTRLMLPPRRRPASVLSLVALSLLLSSCGLAEFIAGPPPKTSSQPSTPGTNDPGTPNATGPWRNISPPIDLSLFGADQFGFQTIGLSPANPNVIYQGTCYEGIWKSTDRGASWSRVSTGVNGPNLATGRNWALAVDPTNADVVYSVAGYGVGQGLWKSVNGGVDWMQMLPDSLLRLATADIYSVTIDPSDRQHLLLGSHSGWGGTPHAGIYESKDGGATWLVHPPGGPWGAGHLVFFITPTTWLNGTHDAGYWRTTDAGATWTQVSRTNVQHGGAQMYRTAAGVLYATGSGTLLRSTDSGATWTAVGPRTQEGFFGIVGDGTYLYTQRANTGLATTPNQPYYVSRETDGLTWTAHEGGAQRFANGPMNMVYDATNRIVYSSNGRAGVWKLELSR